MASSSTTSGRTKWETASTSTAGHIPQNEHMADFHEIAPSTSGTSSKLIQKPSYDVLINNRGPDVKKTLATRIYNILRDMKIPPFLDSEEFECGDFLPTTIEAAIRGAILHIAMFSKGYAESPWCLAELTCMLKSGAKIFPVFYHVEPTDLRYVAKGVYANAFETHEKKDRYSPDQLKQWKEALSKVSFFNGEIVKNNDDELRLFQKIVNRVQKERSNCPLLPTKHLAGLEKAVEEVENTFKLDQSNEGVQIVGIWGTGGLGKTTLAMELYNKRCSSMERCSFIFDIREAKKVLHNKQIELLKCLGVDGTSDNINNNKVTLERKLKSFKVLIVMDDVDHVDQLDALVPVKESLGRGSLIIVTTRESQVLTSWGISFLYEMKELDLLCAKQLFCWHAFLQSSPLDGFEELVDQFLEACHGLPLFLKVFGAQLYGKRSKQDWKAFFHEISKILSEEKLEASYNTLDEKEKEAFLDVACFFIGEMNSSAIQFWDGAGWIGSYIWERLLNKCLVELDNDNKIRMHDRVRDLGRKIANKHSPCRFLEAEQIVDSSKQIKKRGGIRGIMAVINKIEHEDPFREDKEACISRQILSLAPSLVGLKFLVINGACYNEVVGKVSRRLVWLRWSNIEQRSLPEGIGLKNLRVLQLCEDSTRTSPLKELWEAESDAPVQLRELVISRCYSFHRFPDSIGCLTQLKRIIIKGAANVFDFYDVRSLPDEFCRLQLLEHLELEYCQIESLPNSFGDLTNLRYLSLYKCWDLERLPVTFKNLILLQHLNLRECKRLILRSDDFQNITDLELLNLSECEQLKELPHHITNQASLKELYLDGLERLCELPVNIGQLNRLEKMTIQSSSTKDLFNLKSFPISLGDLSSLTDLSIMCRNLKSLPTSFGNLSSLATLSIRYCPNLKSLPTTFGNLSSLTKLSIGYCRTLKSLPSSLGDLSSLTDLLIEDCPELKCFPSSVGRLNLLEHLNISNCPISQVDYGVAALSPARSNLKRVVLEGTKVCRISIPEDHYPCLESLKLRFNDILTEIEALPANLQSLFIEGSPEFVKLPSLARLTSVREIEIRGCDQIGKIEDLEGCTRLEILSVETCREVPDFESLERMERLKRVELRATKESAIQMIQKRAGETMICTRAVPDASSVVDSLVLKLGLSPNLTVLDSFSNKDLRYSPELLPNRFWNRNAIMLCYVINSSVQIEIK